MLATALALSAALPAADAAAQGDLPRLPAPPTVQDGAFAPGRVLVGWRDQVTEQTRAELLAEQGWETLRAIEELGVDIVAVPTGKEQDAIARLQSNPAVAYAELDYLAYATGALAAPAAQASPPPVSAQGVQPNDTFWTTQWGMRRVQLPTAWELTQGAPTVVVAVIDSGIDLAHPEFAGRLQTGFDYVDWDTIPQDLYGHGTHVAGVIAAAGNNGRGVAGSAWNVQLLPLRALDQTGVGTASSIAQAVLAASNRNVSVINLSLALSAPSTTLHNAIVIANGNNILLVGAAGNDSQPGFTPAPVRYPAAYPEVVAVAATTRWEDRAGYSNAGPEVELAAPGGEASDPIFSTSLNGAYAMLHGTSMAAAHVSGAAALLRGYAPQWSAAAVRDGLRNTASKVGSTPYIAGYNDRLGFGRIDTLAALLWSITPTIGFAPDSPNLLAAAGQPLPSTVIKLSNRSLQSLGWQVTSISPAWLRVDPPYAGSLSFPNSAALLVGLNSLPEPGLHFGAIGLRTSDPFGVQRNYVITVRVVAAQTLSRTFLPLVGRDAVTPTWQDVSNAGLGLTLGDDGVQTLPLAFPFPFYGRTYDRVYVHANGFLSFDQAYPGPAYAANQCLPNLNAPNNAIFALWDDLHPGLGGRVAYRNTPSYLAVEWRDVAHKSGGVSTFQVILYADGQVRINYGSDVQNAGATVGAENWDASIAWPVACNGAGAPPSAGQALWWNTALP